MNLYIFNDGCVGSVYGVGTYIRELIIALKDSDLNICIVNILSDKSRILFEEIDGVFYWYFPKPVSEQPTTMDTKCVKLYFRNVLYLLQLHIKDKKDLIFHFNFTQYIDFVDSLKRTFDCKIVSVAHFSDWGTIVFDNLQRLRNILNEESPDSFGMKLKRSFEIEKSYYSNVDHTVCLSNYMHEVLCRDYALDATKVSVIPNGLCDVADFSADTKFLREKWNVEPREKIILFAGRVDEIKGISYLIKAFREVHKIEPDSRLVIAGSGDYNKFFEEAKNICMKITFTGLLERTELYELYRIADVGVVPSLFEPFGYVPVEMMMHELPIVATATSGLNEVVDESCGLKVPIYILPDNVEIDTSLLAQKIVFLLQNPVEAKRLGKNGRERYLEKYSSYVFGRNMKAFYSVGTQGC